PMVTCGIDWAQDHHDIAIVDAEGRLVAKRRIPESGAVCADLAAMLADAGDDPKDPIPVAIETPRGLLVGVLRATGRPIYPINPMSVARYRERTSMSGKKSDHADAVTWPISCVPTSTSIVGCLPTPNWRNRSPCSPVRTRMPPGGAPEPAMHCGRCCVSISRVSCTSSP